ncbi:MAG: hypothetical protein HYU64_13675, partial [Armatimonadetes bacterium]|nr:hypothetical protein [Armatimonadota bacterium]
MMALALSGKLLRRPDWIHSAEREANHWTVHLLASRGNLHGMNPGPVLYPEQPYGMEVIVQGLVQLYRSTKKDHYARLAGLAASWFLGNNTAGRAMYDSRTGRVFDGIDEKGVNYNSGAEATISGLLALQEVLEYPQMASYLPCRETAARRFRIWPARSETP